MHYFSIHTQNGIHTGFLIMLPDDESESAPQRGRLAVKLQSENGILPPEAAVLQPYEGTDTPLFWAAVKDKVELSDGLKPFGSIRAEFLTVGGKTFILNDLTGAV
ncbi:hypothetical protein [Neisseria sp.]|uniref:HLGFF motif protein n=1 Tax=Neisseria sp. TaxID=192066 RepID=UPI00359F4365